MLKNEPTIPMIEGTDSEKVPMYEVEENTETKSNGS
jgi:hypothetical protein